MEKAVGNAVAAGILRKRDSDEPKVVARCLPGFALGSIVKEPHVVVLAKRWELDPVRRHPLVSELARDTRDEYRAGVWAAEIIRVHTGTSTVHGSQTEMEWMIDVEERIQRSEDSLTEAKTRDHRIFQVGADLEADLASYFKAQFRGEKSWMNYSKAICERRIR